MNEAEPEADAGIGTGLGQGLVSATGLSVIGQVAALATALVATPFVLRLITPAQYGFLALVEAILSYLVLADLGMGLASTRFAADALARGDEEEEVAVVWLAMVITAGPVLLLAGALWIGAGSLSGLFHLPRELHGQASMCLRLAAVAGVARVAGNVLNTSQLARLRWSTFILVNSGTATVQVALTPVVLAIWPNLVAVGALLAGTSVLACCGQFFFSRRVQPKLLPPRLHRAPTLQLTAFGGALMVWGLANIPLYNASQFFLARLASAREVAYYAVALTFAGLLSVGPVALAAPLLPALTRARHDRPTLERVYGLALRLVSLWVPPAALLLFFAARPVLTAWAGSRYGANSTHPFYIMLCGMVVSLLGYVPVAALTAYGYRGVIARLRLFELVPYLVIAYGLISQFGIIGAAIAWSLRYPVELIVVSMIVWRRIGLSPRGLIAGGARRGLSLLTLVLPPLIPYALGAPPWVTFGVAVGNTLIHTIVLWRWVLSDNERKAVLELISRIVPLPARRLRYVQG